MRPRPSAWLASASTSFILLSRVVFVFGNLGRSFFLKSTWRARRSFMRGRYRRKGRRLLVQQARPSLERPVSHSRAERAPWAGEVQARHIRCAGNARMNRGCPADPGCSFVRRAMRRPADGHRPQPGWGVRTPRTGTGLSDHGAYKRGSQVTASSGRDARHATHRRLRHRQKACPCPRSATSV